MGLARHGAGPGTGRHRSSSWATGRQGRAKAPRSLPSSPDSLPRRASLTRIARSPDRSVEGEPLLGGDEAQEATRGVPTGASSVGSRRVTGPEAWTRGLRLPVPRGAAGRSVSHGEVGGQALATSFRAIGAERDHRPAAMPGEVGDGPTSSTSTSPCFRGGTRSAQNMGRAIQRERDLTGLAKTWAVQSIHG